MQGIRRRNVGFSKSLSGRLRVAVALRPSRFSALATASNVADGIGRTDVDILGVDILDAPLL
jgi:hypothetical protein